MSYSYGPSGSAAASSSSLGTYGSPASAHAPVTRSRTGLFLSYRDTVIRSSSTSRTGGASRYSDRGKGKGRAYDIPGDDEGEQEGLLAGTGDRLGGNGHHDTIQMNQLPPQW